MGSSPDLDLHGVAAGSQLSYLAARLCMYPRLHEGFPQSRSSSSHPTVL